MLRLGPASTTQKRTVSPGLAVSGCVLYCAAYPFQVTQSGVICVAFVTSRPAAVFSPAAFRYHSLETSTYCLSTAGMLLGSTMIAPYMPFAMCMNAGAVPQWYMKTPGTSALKEKCLSWPGSTSEKATFGAILAAWKSTECGIGELLCSVTFTVWPWRTWITGPGAVFPNVQASYLMPGAIDTVACWMSRRTFATAPGEAAGNVAGYASCAMAIASAFAGAMPA